MNKAKYQGADVYIRAEFELSPNMVLISYTEDGPAFKVNAKDLENYSQKN